MKRRIADFLRSELSVLITVAAARLVLHIATNGNYGFYGPPLGLPHAMGLTNSFWYRGYDPRLPETVIVTGFDLAEGRRLFASCAVAARNTNSFGVENEESRDHPDILLCRNLRMPWPVYWEHYRRFG